MERRLAMARGKPKKYHSLFQEPIKREFLDQFDNQGTYRNYLSRLGTIGEYEFLFEKDLYDFDIEEIQLILNDIGGKPAAIHNWGSLIRRYIAWAMENNFIVLDEQILKQLNNDFYLSFASDLFYTKDEIDYFLQHHCNNLENKIILLLLFEGLNPKEICCLKYLDVDHPSATLYISSRNKYIRNIPEELLAFIEESKSQLEYLSDNGKRKYIGIEHGYILKKINTNANETKTVGEEKIGQALKRINKELTPNAVRFSGMLYFAMLEYQHAGKLSNKHYDKIIERFNINKVMNNKIPTSPYYQLRTINLINEDTIKKYYINLNLADVQVKSDPLWKIKELNGLAGEKVVWNYLEREFPDCHLLKPADKEGYDIEIYKSGRKKSDRVILKRIEVKTVQKNGSTIHITLNELKKAKAYGDQYSIYLVRNFKEEMWIYNIINPIETFDINIDELDKVIDSPNFSIAVSSIKVKIKEELLNTISPVKLTR